MVHQHFSLVPAMTVAENVALGGHGLLRVEEVIERILEIGEKTGLSLPPLALVADLGAADRQKLEIIRTLAHNARILILDEPTAVLTPHDVHELFQQLRVFADAGGTVILITHKLRDAAEHADQVTVLRHGQSVLASPMASLNTDALVDAMLGESKARAEAGRPAHSHQGNVMLSLREVRLSNEHGRPPITFDVHAGEIVGVAALDGAAHGLLQACGERAAVYSGSIVVKGSIGFVPENRQQEAIVPDFRLSENLALRNSGIARGLLDWSDVERRTATLMEEFDVRANGPLSRASELSGGNQQRFVLGRELHENPGLLILENPTQGLDIRASAAIHERVRMAAAGGTAVLFYSSDLDEIADLSDRVIVFRRTGCEFAPPDRDRIGQLLLESTDVPR
jgi:simple sugar transport system ATP-binding protein